jgi:hypothetical protein
MAEVRIAKNAFITEVDGQMLTVRKGLIIDAAHPVLKGREDLFARPEELIELHAPESKKQAEQKSKKQPKSKQPEAPAADQVELQ